MNDMKGKMGRLSSGLLVLILVLTMVPWAALPASAATADLFFSEYIEGSSNNKALEIYNGTGAAIDLAAGGYSVKMYFNGNASAGLTIALTGTVADGDVYVLAHSSAAAAILTQADQTNGSGWFNGNDAVVLYKGTIVLDAIGQVGFDPGTEWGSGDASTQDNTLRRKADICAGDTDEMDAFDPSLEWDGLANNTFDGLGAHTANCGGPGPEPGQPLPLSEGFDDCTLAGWEIISVDADTAHTWSCNATYSNIEANGYGDTAPADEWLITPPLNLDAQGNDTLTFRNYTNYSDVDYPQLHVLYSTGYDGGGDPASATWTELSGITFAPAGSGSWVDSGEVDLSGISGTNVYLAFHYVSSGTGSGTAAVWRLDDINVFEGAPSGQPLPLSEGFDDCTLAGWEIVSVDADAAHTWACSETYSNIEANGYGDTAPANEWLITPALNLNAQENDTLTFRTYTNYTDGGLPWPQLQVLYSTNYDGGGDPASATWTALSGITFSPENSRAWTDSGDVDLSGISGTNVYLAFQYQSSGTGSGTASDWRLDGINVFEGAAPGQTLPLSEGFDDCTLAGWEIISVDADAAHTWSCSTTYSNIEANGYGDTAPANDWLITPPLDLDAQENDTLTFRTYTNYTDSGLPWPQLQVLYSTDYDGGGDPASATWTALSGITFSPENSRAWTDSGEVDLSGISGTNVYLAFQYQSSGTGSGTASDWRLDEINVFERAVPVKIHDIQGSGMASPVVGGLVIIEGIVVGDFQRNAASDNGDLRGFYVQEEDADVDADPATSEGIFVYDGYSPTTDVMVGDLVSVEGQVAEYNGVTEITNLSDIAVVSGGNPAPTAATVVLPLAAVADLEAYEGMSVVLPGPVYISEYYNFDYLGEIVLTSARQNQPTAVVEPGPDAVALAQANLLDSITLDDGRTESNPDPALHPNGGVFDLTNLFRGGDTLQNVRGVLDYASDLYRIQPTQGAVYTKANPRTNYPDDVGGNLKVASFNVLNYFTTIDNGPGFWICGPSGDMECRGADTEEEFTRQRNKIIAALAAIDADVVGLIEIENYPGDVPTADLVQGLNDVLGAGTYDYIATGAIGTDAIRQAFIYKPATVTALGAYAVLDSSVDSRFLDGYNRPVLAQTFQDNTTGGIFTVAVNHLKSKGSDCNAIGDPDLGDGAGNCNLTRMHAAEALIDWLASDPTGSGDGDFLIIGDLNSYDKEDPVDVLLAGGYTDLIYHFLGEYAYSYVFDRQLGYLDHGLANPGLLDEVTGTTVWHINADEPDLIDYDMTYKQAAQAAIYWPDAYRSSDHDPVIVGLGVCDEIPPELTVSVSPDMLWPANHKYVDVFATVTVSDNFDPNPTVTLVSVTSNEDDDGLGDGDTPDDILIVDDYTFQLRAERSALGEGRVYTITYQATDACGNSTTVSVMVTVPHDNKGKND
jgi:predicted extracellular nuclease